MQVTARNCFLLLFVLFAGGCKTLDKGDGKEEENAQPPSGMKIPVGTIHMIDPQGRFVLIRSSRTFQVESGTRMTSYAGDGSVTGIFEVSNARKGAFLTADILQGTPKKGEQVLMDYKNPLGSDSLDAVSPGMNTEVQVLE